MGKLSTRYVWHINGAQFSMISFWNYDFEDGMRGSDKENEELYMKKYMNHIFNTNINEKN